MRPDETFPDVADVRGEQLADDLADWELLESFAKRELKVRRCIKVAVARGILVRGGVMSARHRHQRLHLRHPYWERDGSPTGDYLSLRADDGDRLFLPFG